MVSALKEGEQIDQHVRTELSDFGKSSPFTTIRTKYTYILLIHHRLHVIYDDFGRSST